MKALFKISGVVAGAFLLLIGTEARAQFGPPPPPMPPHMPPPGGGFMPPSVAGGGFPGGFGGPPRLPAGSAPRMGPSGPPRAGGFNRPSAPGGGFRAGGGVPRPPTSSRAPNISRPGPSRIGSLAPNGKLAGGGPKPRTPNITRPGSSRTGGLAPNSKLAGGGNKQPQLPSTVQSLPKGGGSVLPSIAQGKQPGAGQAGKGFPDLSGKGANQLANGALGTSPSVAQGLMQGPGAAGKGFPNLSGKGPGLVSGALGAGALGATPLIGQGKLPGPGPEGKGLPNVPGEGAGQLLNRAPEANQQFWKNWSEQNQGKLADFQANRSQDWNNIQEFRNNQNIAGSFNQPEWNDFKNNVQNYHDNRAIEVTNNIQNSFDNNFNSDWWKDHGGDYADKYASYADKYGSYYDKYGSYAEKYWWWGAATYGTAATWLALDRAYGNSGSYDNGNSGSYDSGNSGSYDSGNSGSYDSGSSGNYDYRRSRSYDYGVNVVYEGDDVYVDGKREASAEEYSQQAITLANTPEEQPPAPMPPEDGKQAEYLPLGVWAMVQEEKGDAYMFFQISIDKNGVVTGAYKNLLGGEVSPISGQVDKKTQRVAWKIGSNNTVIETGLQNLTQEVASCLVHFDTDTTQTWLLVRLKQPEMAKTPESGPVADGSK